MSVSVCLFSSTTLLKHRICSFVDKMLSYLFKNEEILQNFIKLVQESVVNPEGDGVWARRSARETNGSALENSVRSEVTQPGILRQAFNYIYDFLSKIVEICQNKAVICTVVGAVGGAAVGGLVGAAVGGVLGGLISSQIPPEIVMKVTAALTAFTRQLVLLVKGFLSVCRDIFDAIQNLLGKHLKPEHQHLGKFFSEVLKPALNGM